MVLQRLYEAQKEKRKWMKCPTGWCDCNSCIHWDKFKGCDMWDIPEDDTNGKFCGEL